MPKDALKPLDMREDANGRPEHQRRTDHYI